MSKQRDTTLPPKSGHSKPPQDGKFGKQGDDVKGNVPKVQNPPPPPPGQKKS